ncbi:MAG: hypothetical protein ACKV22_07560 [Bryobacteraceae bacterium]
MRHNPHEVFPARTNRRTFASTLACAPALVSAREGASPYRSGSPFDVGDRAQILRNA